MKGEFVAGGSLLGGVAISGGTGGGGEDRGEVAVGFGCNSQI